MLRDWTDVLLLHLIRDARTIEKLSGKLEVVDVSTLMLDNIKGFLWKCSKEYYANAGQPIPQHFLVAQVVDVIQAGGMSTEEIDSIGGLIDFIYTVEQKDMNTDIALQYARKLLEQVRVNSPIQDMLQEGADVSKIFETFQAGLAAASISMAEPIDTLASWQSMLGSVKPEPIGGSEVGYFNTLVNGGLCPGEIVIMLGPMGGFKTTIALDVICAMAGLKQYSLFMAYEQSYKGGDLPIRFMSRLSGIDRDILMNTPPDQLPESCMTAINQAKEFSPYAMFLDRSQSIDKVADIAAQVRDLDSAGRKPQLIVIDQLMTWMQLWPESSSKDESWFRKESTAVIKKLKAQVCEKFGTRILVLHQITPGSIGKHGGQSFAHTESAENKSIGFWADFVLAIGTKDIASNVFEMSAGKVRRGQNQAINVQALPSTCKFRHATDWTRDSTGKFVPQGQGNVMSKPPPVNPPPGQAKTMGAQALGK